MVATVVDNLTSESSTDALSANQGRILKGYIEDNDTMISTIQQDIINIEEKKKKKIQKNGVNLPITNKTVNITVPTKISELENDSGYVKNTDYATISTGGVVKVGSNSSVDYGFNLTNDGVLYARQKNYTDYLSLNNNYAISKGTLENVIVNKTNTSVFSNNFGHIKSKYRIATRGYTSGATWYYPLCKLPVDGTNNDASATIRGRIGGWNGYNMSSIYSMIWNRDVTGMTVLDLAGKIYNKTQTIDEVWKTCDILIYTNSDNSDTVYLKCKDYFCFDLDLELFQDIAQILYDGSYLTSEPSGTLSAQASTANERMELYNSALYVKGNKVLTNSDIVDDLTSTSTTNVLSANQGNVLDSKKLETTNIKAGDNITLSVDGKNITINSIGGGSGSEEVEIGDTEPTHDTIELWVDTSEQGTGNAGVERQVATFQPASGQGTGTTQIMINFTDTLINNSNIFVLENGKVKVNKTCIVELSGSLRFGWSDATKKNILLYKNNTNIYEISQNPVSATTEVLPQIFLPVEAGDTLSIEVLTGASCTIVPSGSFLSISNVT